MTSILFRKHFTNVKSEKRLIKRYSNRKLYDTKSSKYVTLAEIASMIKAGDDVTIIVNSTKEDITSTTLAQIIMEEQKNLGSANASILRNIIRSGGEKISSFLTQNIHPQLQSMRRDAEKNLEMLAAKGRFTIKDGRKALKDFAASAKKTADELQKRIDQGIESTISNITIPAVESVDAELANLQRKVSAMEKRLKKSKKEAGNL